MPPLHHVSFDEAHRSPGARDDRRPDREPATNAAATATAIRFDDVDAAGTSAGVSWTSALPTAEADHVAAVGTARSVSWTSALPAAEAGGAEPVTERGAMRRRSAGRSHQRGNRPESNRRPDGETLEQGR